MVALQYYLEIFMGNSSAGTKLPSGYGSPFTRVAQEGSHDDLLACIATLTGKPLADVRKTAHTLGMRQHGPHWVTDALVQQLLWNLSNLMAGEWIEFSAKQAMPEVAILCVDFDAASDLGRHVILHSVREDKGAPSFSHVIDPANWIAPERQVTADLSGLQLKPSWYREISPRPQAGKAKGK